MGDIDALKRYLGQTAPFLGARNDLETGIHALDHLLSEGRDEGGLPQGALTVIGGAPGSGRASLAAKILARDTQAGRPVAWIDMRGLIYPPALMQAGIVLERLLLIRCDPDRALYAAEQILGSGAFGMVAMSGFERSHLTACRTRRLQTAAETAQTSGFLLLDPTRTPRLTSAALELRLCRRGRGIMVTIERNRLGPSGKRTFIPLEEPDPSISPRAPSTPVPIALARASRNHHREASAAPAPLTLKI